MPMQGHIMISSVIKKEWEERPHTQTMNGENLADMLLVNRIYLLFFCVVNIEIKLL